jgi:hypothetical protein
MKLLIVFLILVGVLTCKPSSEWASCMVNG